MQPSVPKPERQTRAPETGLTASPGPDPTDMPTAPYHEEADSAAEQILQEARLLFSDQSRYEVLDLIRGGGMGVVLRAQDKDLDRKVALKLIRRDAPLSAEYLARFEREARAAARLTHPNIVTIFDVGRRGRQPYYTMRYAAGGSLTDHIGRFQGQSAACALLIEKTARAVQAAHDKDVLHRDLKPGNILIDENGEPLVSDFGLAKFSDSEVSLTEAGATPGTPGYMAPEQVAGKTVTGLVDVWALGVILYELLTGKRPFQAPRREELFALILNADPQPPRVLRPEIDPRLERIVLKCLRKDPEERYASAAHLADDLERWRKGEPTEAESAGVLARKWRQLRKRGLRTALISAPLLLLLIGLFILFGLNRNRQEPPISPVEPEPALNSLIEHLNRDGQLKLVTGPSLPAYYKTRAGSADISMADGNSLSVKTLSDACLVELLPHTHVPSHFRLSAQIRHHEALGRGYVGIYFGERRIAMPEGTDHWFFRLALAEPGPLAASIKGGDKPRSPLVLSPYRYRDASSQGPAFNAELASMWTGRFVSAPGTWRHIEIEVSPDELKIFWEGKLEHSLTRQEVTTLCRFDLKRFGPKDKPEDLFVGGIGLYACRSEGRFRNVEITPLPVSASKGERP
jgi:serine/threonine protein kinase